MNTTISQLLTIRQETADALATMPSWVPSEVTQSYYRTVAWCNQELTARGIDPQADYDVVPTERQASLNACYLRGILGPDGN
jgi:hypothetical protein